MVEQAAIRLDLTTLRHVGMGHSPEAGYNLEAHHTGGKPVYWLKHVACRGRIPQSGLRRLRRIPQFETLWGQRQTLTQTLWVSDKPFELRNDRAALPTIFDK